MEEKVKEPIFFSVNGNNELTLKQGYNSAITLTEKDVDILSVVIQGLYRNNK